MSDLKGIIRPGTKVYIPATVFEATIRTNDKYTYGLNSHLFKESLYKQEEDKDFYTLKKIISTANTQDLLDELRERYPDVDLSSVLNESTIKMMEDNMKKWEDSKKKTEEESSNNDNSEAKEMTCSVTNLYKFHICPICNNIYDHDALMIGVKDSTFNCTKCGTLLKNPIFETEEESSDNSEVTEILDKILDSDVAEISEVKEMIYDGYDEETKAYGYRCPLCRTRYKESTLKTFESGFHCMHCNTLLNNPV